MIHPKPVVSVVMASFLGFYGSCATNRIEKFKRAVKSFINQDISDLIELIIVSDGCSDTNECFAEIQRQELPRNRLIKLVKLNKQEHLSGTVRNAGILATTADIICYLDTDDILLPGHIKAIYSQMGTSEWVFWDDMVATAEDLSSWNIRNNVPQYGHIGTSSIAHRRRIRATWQTGYGHDWLFVESLLSISSNYHKINNAGYLVCHVPAQTDF
jgi:glycosyltransferase involved in cell wall biosynthesis